VSLSVIQKGLTRALILLFFPSPIGKLRAKIIRAVGPTPTIIITETATGSESLSEIMSFAQAQTGRVDITLVCLGGFSAGCQRVRALRMAGAAASVYLLIDGAHASNPPAAWQLEYLKELVAMARQRETTLVISHTYVVTEPAYLSTAAIARIATGWELPKPAPGTHDARSDGNLTVYSVYSDPVDVVAHSAQAMIWLPVILDGHVRPILEPGHEPGTRPTPRIRRRVCTADGWMDFEGEYVPRVVTRENGDAPPEALKAQAIAARTFALRAMLEKPSLGTAAAPLRNSEGFQTYASAAASACETATKATAWHVATYQRELILANYVAGARWSPDGKPMPGTDPRNTERWVTYNAGRYGDQVEPTRLVSRHHKQNRGCMSQHGSRWLARHGYNYLQILRCFYGADLELVDLRERSGSLQRRTKEDAGPLVLLTGAVGIAWLLAGKSSL
jgi:hypothetical protein